MFTTQTALRHCISGHRSLPEIKVAACLIEGGLKKPPRPRAADLIVYIWGEEDPDLLRGCIVSCIWLLLLQPLVSSLSLMKK